MIHAVSGYLRAMEDFAKIAIELVARHLPRDIAITIIGEYISNTWDCGHTLTLHLSTHAPKQSFKMNSS